MKREQIAEAAKLLRRQAAADRLWLIVQRSVVYADEFEDISMALDTLGLDILEADGNGLTQLYRDLIVMDDDPPDTPRYLSQQEREAVLRAAELMARGGTSIY